jgi:undecaprenyl diphosphate synthase
MINQQLAAPLTATAPRHVAIIMDGNRRWATARGLPAIEGHRRGVRSLQRTVAAAARAGVDVLTVYAFSEENWGRPTDEVALLMELGRMFVRREADALVRANVRARIIGKRDRLPVTVGEALAELEERTRSGSGMILNLAIDYSARTELCDAIRALAHDVADGKIEPDAIDDDAIGAKLSTAGLPDPDLLIRTGGELRLSNFLLYQCAYTELWSTLTPWPEFDGHAFDAALAAFAGRQRRFGR